jgi:hypothetical protein
MEKECPPLSITTHPGQSTPHRHYADGEDYVMASGLVKENKRNSKVTSWNKELISSKLISSL